MLVLVSLTFVVFVVVDDGGGVVTGVVGVVGVDMVLLVLIWCCWC